MHALFAIEALRVSRYASMIQLVSVGRIQNLPKSRFAGMVTMSVLIDMHKSCTRQNLKRQRRAYETKPKWSDACVHACCSGTGACLNRRQGEKGSSA